MSLRARPWIWAYFICHLTVLLWFVSSWERTRLMLFSFREVPNEQAANVGPAALVAYGYEEDPIDQLTEFKAIAEPLVSGAETAAERAMRLSDYIYGLRKPDLEEDAEGDIRVGPTKLLHEMQAGKVASCGQMSIVLAAFWRSLGGHTRGVRWGTPEGEIGHYGLELFDDARHRWFYFDMNLRGYAVDDDKVTPLSVGSIRTNAVVDEDFYLVTSPQPGDFDRQDFIDVVRAYPLEWFVMSNRTTNKEPDRRFGRLHKFHRVLSKLPDPADRIADNLSGDRDRRLVVAGRMTVGGLFTLHGARLFLVYMCLACVLSGALLRSDRRAVVSLEAPTAPA